MRSGNVPGLEGRSLAPLPNNPTAAWDKPALSVVARESWLGRSLRTERWCYTKWDEGRYGVELYDHQADPREMKNLAPELQHAATVAELREKLHKSPLARKNP